MLAFGKAKTLTYNPTFFYATIYKVYTRSWIIQEYTVILYIKRIAQMKKILFSMWVLSRQLLELECFMLSMEFVLPYLAFTN